MGSTFWGRNGAFVRLCQSALPNFVSHVMTAGVSLKVQHGVSFGREPWPREGEREGDGGYKPAIAPHGVRLRGYLIGRPFDTPAVVIVTGVVAAFWVWKIVWASLVPKFRDPDVPYAIGSALAR